MNLPLYICIGGAVLYAAVLCIYIPKIKKAKKHIAPGKIIPAPSKSFKAIFFTALALLVLPILIPLETYLIVVVCGCAVLGAYLALKDRLEQIQKLSDN
jgi:hypothetical protein